MSIRVGFGSFSNLGQETRHTLLFAVLKSNESKSRAFVTPTIHLPCFILCKNFSLGDVERTGTQVVVHITDSRITLQTDIHKYYYLY